MCPANVQTRDDGPLPGTNQLSAHLLLHAEGMDIQTSSGRGPEADDELNLSARNRNKPSIPPALLHKIPRHRGRGRRARRYAIALDCTPLHVTSLLG